MGIISALKYVAIINSRQPLRPSGRSAWIKATRSAIEWAKTNCFGLVSSVGVPSWEITTALGSIGRTPMKLIIPTESSDRFKECCRQVVMEFDLSGELVEFIQCDQKVRDSLVFQAADLVVPISIRSRGLLEELLGRSAKLERAIRSEFQIPYEKRNRRLAYTLEGMDLNPELHEIPENYVIHWTRATHAPWPDERKIDFYKAILNSDRYPRLAIDTLEHILNTETIIGSARNISSRAPVVSLSTIRPSDLTRLVRWRSRRKLMSFEPYGIGFAPELAKQLGIKRAIYYDSDNPPPDETEKWRCQTMGKITDWREEREMRCPGEIRLNDLPREQMTLFCLTVTEALSLQERYQIKTVPFLPR